MIKNRPTRHEIYLKVAYLISSRGTCGRKQVGCVITSKQGRIISTGYNGTLPGGEHCSEQLCDLGHKCQESIHAEANAISYAARSGIVLQGAILYCTTAPCLNCARLIIQSGVNEVFYKEDYTDDEGIIAMEDHGVTVYKWSVPLDTK